MTETQLVYDYVKLNADRLPDYWKDKGTHVCIDGICCMIAKDRYTFAQIAEFYECSVALVMQINEAYEKTIDRYKAMHEEMKSTYGELYTNHTVSDNNDGYLDLACAILERCRKDD